LVVGESLISWSS
ncbi:unnamed protein product, partial [Oikopleura dioica]